MEILKIKEGMPDDYHCNCEYCSNFKGTIFDPNGNMFSSRKRIGYRQERSSNNAHICKTPFGIALWATHALTEPGDWIIDPTMGVGTSGVEAKKQGRNAIGIELNPLWAKVSAANLQQHPGKHIMVNGDARDWEEITADMPKMQLIINNPPYSGDENVSIKTDEFGDIIDREQHAYDQDKRNLAFLKENEVYYQLLGEIYNGLGEKKLKKDGYLVIGVKDMVHNKAPYMLHKKLCDSIDRNIYDYHGTWLLPHYPRTLFMNTYPKRFPEVKIPMYQTINVFKKK